MPETGSSPRFKTFTDFSDFVKVLLEEHLEGNWGEFIDHVKTVVNKNYAWDKQKIKLNPMYWNMLKTMGPTYHNVTLDVVKGERGLQQLLSQAQENAEQSERMIHESLDSKNLFINQKRGRDALPNERYIEFTKQKGSFVVLGTGGQGFVIYGRLKQLPYEIFEKFYNLMISRLHRKDKDTARDKTTTVLKGARSFKDKALKLQKAIVTEWRLLFENSGYVFDAKKHFGRDVAVKVFPRKGLSTIGDFEKEAKFIGWPNPHIMPILAQETSKNGISIVLMPYIDTKYSVSPEQTSRNYSLSDVTDIIEKLCQALGQIHKECLVHRDIKPGNIIVMREKSFGYPSEEVLRPILTDFGLASIPEYTAYSISNTLKGTPLYLPPEQAIDAKRARPQSDMYSLALWAYELLTGQTFNPENEQLSELINRLWNLAKGAIYHKPEIPSSLKRNIANNELSRKKFSGIFKWFKKHKENKRLQRHLEGLEKIIARMIITQDGTPVIEYCSKQPEYRKIVSRQGGLAYKDLIDVHKDEFISKIVELRYRSMDDVIEELKRVRDGKKPLTPDYRNRFFLRMQKKSRIGLFMILLGLSALLATVIGYYTGHLNRVIEFLLQALNQ